MRSLTLKMIVSACFATLLMASSAFAMGGPGGMGGFRNASGMGHGSGMLHGAYMMNGTAMTGPGMNGVSMTRQGMNGPGMYGPGMKSATHGPGWMGGNGISSNR